MYDGGQKKNICLTLVNKCLRIPKGHSIMENPEAMTGNIGCTRHKTKTSKERHTERKRMSNTEPHRG